MFVQIFEGSQVVRCKELTSCSLRTLFFGCLDNIFTYVIQAFAFALGKQQQKANLIHKESVAFF